MKSKLVHNATAQLPDVSVSPGDVIEAVQLCPFGDFPQGGVVQHCTDLG